MWASTIFGSRLYILHRSANIMQTLWKLSQDVKSASRTLDNGSFESRLVSAIPEEELLLSLPADLVPISEIKSTKKDAIRTSFEDDIALPVVVNLVSYAGGMDSALKLDAAKRLAEAMGLTSVTFFDINNAPQVLLLADALAVVVAVGVAYQTSLARKQAALVKIDNANTETNINKVVF
jgi:hypothetical protein